MQTIVPTTAPVVAFTASFDGVYAIAMEWVSGAVCYGEVSVGGSLGVGNGSNGPVRQAVVQYLRSGDTIAINRSDSGVAVCRLTVARLGDELSDE